MKKYFRNYIGFWLVLVVVFAFFAVMSASEKTEKALNIKSSKIWPTLTKAHLSPVAEDDNTAGGKHLFRNTPGQGNPATAARPVAPKPQKKVVETDTVPKTILFFGDSMLDGLYPRLAAYANQNGHTLYVVIWYSSTSEVWGRSDKLQKYIADLHPDYIFISLGANELFVKDIAEKRDGYVKKIIADIGNIPYIWIGPPNWKEDTGINDLIMKNAGPSHTFVTKGMQFPRMKDGAPPTHEAAIGWMDSVIRWMPSHSDHPIRMNVPTEKKARAKRVFVHQPSEK